MSTQIKWNGQWIDLNLSSGAAKIANIEIEPGVFEENSSFGYEASIPILGMTDKNFAICLLNNFDGEISNIQCINNALKVYASKEISASGIVLFSASGTMTENKIIYIGQVSEREIERIVPEIMEKLHMQSTFVYADDGGQQELFEFTNLRQVTGAVFKRETCSEDELNQQINKDMNVKEKITVTYALQGNSIESSPKVDTIYLNENDYPVRGISNGVEWTIGWEGFGGESSE